MILDHFEFDYHLDETYMHIYIVDTPLRISGQKVPQKVYLLIYPKNKDLLLFYMLAKKAWMPVNI